MRFLIRPRYTTSPGVQGTAVDISMRDLKEASYGTRAFTLDYEIDGSM
jgi:hypothetical protein